MRYKLVAAALIFLPPCSALAAHESSSIPKPVSADDPRLTFSFPVTPDQKPLSFKVNVDRQGAIVGVSVFRAGESVPFQTLPSCRQFPDQINEFWTDHEIAGLVSSADLNFDGFNDLELLQNFIPHLDKRVYCIFLWDHQLNAFRLSSDLSKVAINLEPHAETKSLTSHEDWQGADWRDSTYRWKEGKLELIEQNGLMDGTGSCQLYFYCSRMVDGKLTKTFEKWICFDDLKNLPKCPGSMEPSQ